MKRVLVDVHRGTTHVGAVAVCNGPYTHIVSCLFDGGTLIVGHVPARLCMQCELKLSVLCASIHKVSPHGGGYLQADMKTVECVYAPFGLGIEVTCYMIVKKRLKSESTLATMCRHDVVCRLRFIAEEWKLAVKFCNKELATSLVPLLEAESPTAEEIAWSGIGQATCKETAVRFLTESGAAKIVAVRNAWRKLFKALGGRGVKRPNTDTQKFLDDVQALDFWLSRFEERQHDVYSAGRSCELGHLTIGGDKTAASRCRGVKVGWQLRSLGREHLRPLGSIWGR